MPIRVIAGSAKGRRLKMVPGDSTRPVMDRVKEALFSILGRSILESAFLDLFAGTGSVGIEALSRGASYVLFVEVDRLALKTIQENLALTKLSEKAEVRRVDVFTLLKQKPPQAFDFIYVAPPQFRDMWPRTLEALEANPAWIPPGTIVIVQIAPNEQKPVDLKYLKPYDERRYGKTLLWFFEAAEEAE
jgi:16S rRNA (guanine(966)-N(2))-methyltransferase RsmD